MAFDPDAYLAEGGGVKETPFDPDSYLGIEKPVGTSIGQEISQIPAALKESFGQPLEAMGETAQVAGFPAVGAALKGAIQEPEGYVSAGQRFMEPQEGEFQVAGFAPQYAPRAIAEQTGQIIGSIGTRLAGAVAGGGLGALISPTTGVAGAAIGQFAGPALFEAAQIVGPVALERAKNNGYAEPTDKDMAYAVATAAGSGLLNAFGAKYLPGGEKAVGSFAKRLAASFIGEGIPEGLQSLTQQVGETIETQKGIQVNPKQAVGEALIGGAAGAAATTIAAPFTPEQIAEAKITESADKQAENLFIGNDNPQGKAVLANKQKLEQEIADTKQVLQAIESTDPVAQKLKLELKEKEAILAAAQSQVDNIVESADPVAEAEKQQIELAKTITAPAEPTVKETLPVQPALAAPVAAPAEQVVTPPVEVAPTIAFQETTGDAEIDAKITKTESMSPDEYLQQAWQATAGKLGVSYEEWMASNKLTEADRAKYSQDMKAGDKFPLPYIDKYGGSQDGRNRALAAKEAGIQSIPVGIIEEPSVDVQIKDLREELFSTTSKIGKARIQERINKLETKTPAPVTEQAAPAEAPAPEVTPAVMESAPLKLQAEDLVTKSVSLPKEVSITSVVKTTTSETPSIPQQDIKSSRYRKFLGESAPQAISQAKNALSVFKTTMLGKRGDSPFQAEPRLRELKNSISLFVANRLNVTNQKADEIAEQIILGKPNIVDKVTELKSIKAKELDDIGAPRSSITRFGYELDDKKTYRHPREGEGKPKLGEKGGILIPSKEDFIQAGQNIYEAGMEFGAWAKQMIQRFGDAVREFLGEVWQAVSGAPAKLNELMGYLPKKGEAGAVNIGQGENAPIKPEAKTVTEGLVQGIDIGKENNMPINNKIESHIKNFAFVRGIFESASDRLRRAKFTKLATAIDDYYDQAQRRLGFANKILLPAFEEYSKQSKATKAKIDEEVKMFFAAQENKRDTAEFFDELNPITQKIVTAWQKFGEESGKENQRIGIKVYDKGLQRWRPIGRIEKFWPRVLKPEYKRALMEPDKYQKEYNEIVEALMKSGRIETPEEAEVFISDYQGMGGQNDYFSGIEVARGQAFPEELYDYSTQVMTDYVARWAQHSSRIEQFGQKLGENSKTIWDRSRESTRDRRTIDYITAAQERVEGYYPNDPIVKGMATLNIWASGLQLGNPASAMLNFFGGTTLNAMVGQPGALSSYVSSFTELRKLGKELKDAREKGIVSRDLMNIVGDHQVVLESNGIAKAGQKTADFLLKWSGFTPVEQMVRTQSMIIGKSFLRKTLLSLSKNPNSSFSKRSLTWLNRNNIDADKLIVEQGTGPETDKLLRYFANISQGSYTIAQSPIFTDTPIGRFLFKYQKFSTQVMRQSWKNTFEPAWKAVTNKNETLQLPEPTRQLLYRLRLAEAKELGDNRKITLDEIPKKVTKAEGKALTIIPVMMWLGSAYVGGEVILRMRDMLFGVLMKGPSYEDIIRAFEDDEDDDELYLSLERAWYNLIGMGALGLIGNYTQFFMDWQDRERVKNPLDPPALSIFKEIATFIQNAADQGKITAGDINNYLNRTLSAYRVSQRLYQTAASGLGYSKAPTVAEEMFRRETASLNKYARRWAASAGLEYRTKRPMDIAPGKMTPINREISSYLQRGEPGAAVAYAKEYLNSLPKKERANAIQSMESGARNRQPLRLGSGPMDQAEKIAFKKWLKEKVSKEDFDKFQKLDSGYQKTYNMFLSGLPNK